MKIRFAPWRQSYLATKPSDFCVFCEDGALEEKLVVFRGKQAFVVMNLYPYTSGHLLVVPYRHLSDMEELTGEERNELFELLTMAVRALKEYLKPEGFNIGMNIGAAAGAGIAAHLHLHVVPRWYGDTNFMTTLGEVRVIPLDIENACADIRRIFKNLQRQGEVKPQ